MSLAAAIGLAVTVFALPVIWLLGRRADKERAERFGDREEVSPSEVWGRFSEEAGIGMAFVTEALDRLEQATGIAKGRLRPADRFAIELAPAPGWEFDDGLAELAWGLERQRDRRIETVEDFVRAVAQDRAGYHSAENSRAV